MLCQALLLSLLLGARKGYARSQTVLMFVSERTSLNSGAKLHVHREKWVKAGASRRSHHHQENISTNENQMAHHTGIRDNMRP